MKKIILFALMIFLVPTALSLDSQTFIPCLGDEQTMIMCNIGDIENYPIGSIPTEAVITPGGVSVGGGIGYTEDFMGKYCKNLEDFIINKTIKSKLKYTIDDLEGLSRNLSVVLKQNVDYSLAETYLSTYNQNCTNVTEELKFKQPLTIATDGEMDEWVWWVLIIFIIGLIVLLYFIRKKKWVLTNFKYFKTYPFWRRISKT